MINIKITQKEDHRCALAGLNKWNGAWNLLQNNLWVAGKSEDRGNSD